MAKQIGVDPSDGSDQTVFSIHAAYPVRDAFAKCRVNCLVCGGEMVHLTTPAWTSFCTQCYLTEITYGHTQKRPEPKDYPYTAPKTTTLTNLQYVDRLYSRIGFVHVYWLNMSHFVILKPDRQQTLIAALEETKRLREDPRPEPVRLLTQMAARELDHYDMWAAADWLVDNGYPLNAEAIHNASRGEKR